MKRQAELTLGYDLAVFEAMVAELEQYAKSDILYWQLSPATSISPPPPMLTIGGCLLRLYRLKNLQDLLVNGQITRFRDAEATFHTTTETWAAHVEKKVRREINARLNSWSWFVDDCDARKNSCIQFYPTEAELRTLIHFLMLQGSQLDDVDGYRKKLAVLDSRLRRWFQAGDFVWRSELEPAYTQSDFWWLYGKPEFPRD